MHNLKIGYDVSQAYGKITGCGQFAKNLLSSLNLVQDEIELRLFSNVGDFWFNEEKNKPSFNIKKSYNIEWFQTRNECVKAWKNESYDYLFHGLDLIHLNNFWCPDKVVTPKIVFTVYDLNFLEFPDWSTETNRNGCFQGIYNSSLYADHIVFISNFTRKKYLEIFPYYPKNKTSIIYPSSQYEKNKHEKEKPKLKVNIESKKFWLNVSTIEPRKNQTMLLDAYCMYLKQSKNKYPLVIVGSYGWLMSKFESEIENRDLIGQVILAGYISDDELAWCYNHCYGNLYPALYEGFGIPVLEGMLFGAPTGCSNVTSLPEVAGDAAVLLDPKKPNEWSSFMLRLETDLAFRTYLANAGPSQAAKFSSNTSGRTCLDIYRCVVQQNKAIYDSYKSVV
ncbi:MAG: glycosyltransferase family 1 protein [Chlamydiae bacterium]|nr:glycosyltransferase family 1 protein [Chlamydiota bacterium]